MDQAQHLTKMFWTHRQYFTKLKNQTMVGYRNVAWTNWTSETNLNATNVHEYIKNRLFSHF